MQTLQIHVWIRVTLLSFLFLLFTAYSGQASDVTLKWTKPDDSRVVGYKIYYGESGTDYKATPKLTVDTADQTNCLISGLQEGCVYGFAATSFDANGQQSAFSEDLFYSVPETSLDSDGDGLTDDEEISIYGTEPNNPDTDGDGITDGDEVYYWGQNWNADADNDGLINLLDPDADNDGYMDGEEVGVSDPGDSNSVPASDTLPVIEVGELQVDHNWATVAFSKTFADPVVVAKPLSINGDDPSVIRIRNVTPGGFEIRIQEWDYLDGRHAMETVSFIAIERGTYVLENGAKLAADTFYANQTDRFQSLSFQESFGTAPIVISAIITENESDAVTGRIRNITAYGFEFSMQEQEANYQWHTEETVAVIAIEPSMGQIGTLSYEADKTGDQITHDFHSVSFAQFFTAPPLFLADMQTTDGGDTANIRWANKTATSVDVQIDEEQSKDTEINHTTEVVGYIVFSQP